jgi:DNA-binding FrmR family transcriptional regulator
VPSPKNAKIVSVHNHDDAIVGDIAAILQALAEQVMHLIAGVRGAIAGLMAEVIEDHVHTHLVDVEKHPGALNTEAAEQLLEVVRTYLK